MIIIGVDYHPEFQQVALVDTETGEFQEAQLQHREPAEQFFRELAKRGAAVRIGLEASSPSLSNVCDSMSGAVPNRDQNVDLQNAASDECLPGYSPQQSPP